MLKFYQIDFVSKIQSVLISFLYFAIFERYLLLHAFSVPTCYLNFEISLSFLSAGKRKSASSSKIIFDDFMSTSNRRDRLFLLWIAFKCFFKPNADLISLLHSGHLYRCFSCSFRMCVFRLQRLLNDFEQISHETIHKQ